MTAKAGVKSVRMLDEDPYERRMFDESIKLHKGAMAAVASTLEIYHKVFEHPNGSFAKSFAIMANECAKAHHELKRLRRHVTPAKRGKSK